MNHEDIVAKAKALVDAGDDPQAFVLLRERVIAEHEQGLERSQKLIASIHFIRFSQEHGQHLTRWFWSDAGRAVSRNDPQEEWLRELYKEKS